MAKQSQETTNATNKIQINNLVKDLNDLSKTVEGNNKTYYVVFVTKEEFALIKTIVYGFCGVILMAAATAIVKVILK